MGKIVNSEHLFQLRQEWQLIRKGLDGFLKHLSTLDDEAFYHGLSMMMFIGFIDGTMPSDSRADDFRDGVVEMARDISLLDDKERLNAVDDIFGGMWERLPPSDFKPELEESAMEFVGQLMAAGHPDIHFVDGWGSALIGLSRQSGEDELLATYDYGKVVDIISREKNVDSEEAQDILYSDHFNKKNKIILVNMVDIGFV